jgi:putative restriction endonuclease
MPSSGTLIYRYRGTDPNHRDNVGLRLAMARRVPLVYLFGLVPGEYQPVWPVFIVGDDPASLSFYVAVDEARIALTPLMVLGADAEARRRYVTQLTRRRLHQAGFRKRVLRAYSIQCSLCRLKHEELLDAAHILPDGHPRGEPVVKNGVALCSLHHAAFDRHIIGIRPELTVEVREDVLAEVDGPMLRHGLQELHGARIHVPARAELKPDRDFLAERYELFRKAG